MLQPLICIVCISYNLRHEELHVNLIKPLSCHVIDCSLCRYSLNYLFPKIEDNWIWLLKLSFSTITRERKFSCTLWICVRSHGPRLVVFNGRLISEVEYTGKCPKVQPAVDSFPSSLPHVFMYWIAHSDHLWSRLLMTVGLHWEMPDQFDNFVCQWGDYYLQLTRLFW